MAANGRFLRDGLVVGFIAYGAVALFYAAFDLLAARGPLHSVNVLGLAVFRGLRGPLPEAPPPIDMAGILLYNGFHLFAAVTIGLVVVGLVRQAELYPARAPVILLLMVGGFTATVFAVGWLSTSIRSVLPWWSILVANTAAAIPAALYLILGRPKTRSAFLSRPS